MVHALSPHRDDAVFSLYFTLSEFARRSPVSVSNFFTKSSYAPKAGTSDPAGVSQIRKREDRKAIRRINCSIRIRDCELLDAPLRLNIPVRQVFYKQPDDQDVQLVANHIHYGTPELTLAPLGLGGHVDHVTVKRAALKVIPRSRLAFYEDLPYAMRSDDELPAVLRELEEELHMHLVPRIIRGNRRVFEKRAACARYRSQIKLAEADAMAGWSRRYGTGERIWIPRVCLSRF